MAKFWNGSGAVSDLKFAIKTAAEYGISLSPFRLYRLVLIEGDGIGQGYPELLVCKLVPSIVLQNIPCKSVEKIRGHTIPYALSGALPRDMASVLFRGLIVPWGQLIL